MAGITPASGTLPASGTISDGLGIGRAASASYFLAIQQDGADNKVGLRIDNTETVNNPDSAKIVTTSTGYGLKVDRTAGAADTVNIAAPVTGAHTALGVVASNTTLSTVKVTNDAVQTAGAVVGALGTSASRSAPIFRGENSGSGHTFDSLAVENTAIGMQIKAHLTQAVDNLQVKDSGGNVKVVVTNDFRMAIGLAVPSAAALGLHVSTGIRSDTTISAVNGYTNSSSANNSRLQTNSTGSLIDRNIADANHVLIVRNVNASSTGDILSVQKSDNAAHLRVNQTGIGFYGTVPIAKQTGVAVTAAGIHTALVNLGLIAA